jgi:glucosamine 6-phosphate synthetase-like amidotransferase/phosphosugar isomerase protein
VLAMLIGDLYTEIKTQESSARRARQRCQRAVQAALHEVEGTYGIAVICKDEPDTLVVARKGSPLIIGVGRMNTSSPPMPARSSSTPRR